MIEPLKHTFGTAISGVGFYGAVTLSQVSLITSIMCAIAGTIAALCTIHSWWINLHKVEDGDS